MSVFCTRFEQNMRVLIVILGAIFLILASAAVESKDIYWGRKNQKVIVIDPGHGGNDTGAVGPQGTREKDVALSLANILSRQLGKKYRVLLTRDGDYSLTLFRRTGAANHQKADLFLSIHTGGGFLGKASGITIYHQQEKSSDVNRNETTESTDWDDIQYKHLSSSKLWAKMLKLQFDTYVGFAESAIQTAPIVVLEGADMPALMVEIGHLTNPNEEKALQNPETLEHLGTAIAVSIDDYFANKGE